jgi:Tfp pilus assembly protein PilV
MQLLSKPTSSKTTGQTLVEVLVTVVIIAAGVISLIRFQNYLAYDSSITQQTADATVLAIKQIETLRDYQVINTTSGYTDYSSIASGTQSSTVGNTTYSISWTITTFTNPDYKNIDVTVSWTDRRSNTKSVNYISRVASIDPAHSASVM